LGIEKPETVHGSIKEFPKFTFCVGMIISISKYQQMSRHTPFFISVASSDELSGWVC
jgi:thymidylate synthase ThyX